MAGWAAWSPVRERDKLGVVTYNYQVFAAGCINY